ncbi:hypothetical protein EYC59_02420 [Candidatus Saccharibacteria bacterium]|nr:MAG: hypothetical protein EYC59_02420 [Candidatus Saccharibacteria bacterium]
MSASFDERLGFDGNLNEVVGRLAQRYELGQVVDTELLAVGFEDYNLKVTTDAGVYVAKFFSRKRDAAENERYAEVIRRACDAGIQHPKLHLASDGSALFRDGESGLSAVVMDYVAGKTFYDLGVPPMDEQLAQIVAEAVKR